MAIWSRYPTIYEINTWVWLAYLSEKAGTAVDLRSVPASEWNAIAKCGFDAVWLMGVWERSPAGIAIANRNAGLLADFRRALPDFRVQDNVGSPYCVRSYMVDQHLGGPEGLAVARGELAKRGLRLILDFVPNHVAPDHPWVGAHPGYFVQGSADDARNDPGSFVTIGGRTYACGRDPYFPAWPDVLQLNAFQPGLRRAVLETISGIAGQCDGIRCDMAMLVLNDVFERTWGQRAGSRPAAEYWAEIIPATKKAHPDFRFIAEAYWDLEWELQQQAFDFCYDKRLYDRLEHANAESVRLHLCADLAYQEKLLRFIENHDEPRAAAVFSPGEGKGGCGRDGHRAGGETLLRRAVRGTESTAARILGPASRRACRSGIADVLPEAAGSHRCPGLSRGAMEPLRAHGLARQLQLSEPRGLELDHGRRPLSHRRQPQRRRRPSQGSRALGRHPRKDVASDRCLLG